MRTTLNLDEGLIQKAREMTHIEGKTALIHAGLQSLIEKKSEERLAALGGSEKKLQQTPRRKS